MLSASPAFYCPDNVFPSQTLFRSVRIRFGPAVVRLAALGVAEIVRSNIAVARIVLFRPPEQRSGFIEFPTELRSPYALAVLAIILPATPGTLWVPHAARPHVVLIHVLELVDAEEWIARTTTRTQRFLRGI